MVGGLWYAESWVYSVLKRTHVKLRPFCPLSDQDPPCRPTHPPLPEVGWDFTVLAHDLVLSINTPYN